VRKHERAILVVEVLVEAQPRCRTPEQARERRLAHCERVAPQIVACANSSTVMFLHHVRSLQ
jgi:ribosomal protein L32